MASIVKDPGGRRRILWVAADGKRRGLRLGKCSQRDAAAIKVHVERLATAATLGHAIPSDTALWLQSSITDKMADKLADAGLIPARGSAALGPFLDGYVKARSDTKPQTRVVWSHTVRCLKAYFGPQKALRSITAGDAAEWRAWLVGNEHLADGTMRRRTGLARQFFEHARRKGVIQSNPFDGLPAAVRGNADKFYFVSRANADKILAACPDVQWRLLFALARFGGLRIPSEALALTWADVDFEHGRMHVISPKTEHHPGHGSRVLPLFPELADLLAEAFAEAEPGTVHVLTNPVWRARGAAVNVRKGLGDIIGKAGLTVWPKLFVNCRATRAIELRQAGFPDHVVCAWLGHTQAVATEHYLRVTEADFEKAAQGVAQKAAHSVAAPGRTDSPSERAEYVYHGENAELPGDAGQCELAICGSMGADGFEPS